MVPGIVRRKSKTPRVPNSYPFLPAGRRLISLVVFLLPRTFNKKVQNASKRKGLHDAARKQ